MARTMQLSEFDKIIKGVQGSLKEIAASPEAQAFQEASDRGLPIIGSPTQEIQAREAGLPAPTTSAERTQGQSLLEGRGRTLEDATSRIFLGGPTQGGKAALTETGKTINRLMSRLYFAYIKDPSKFAKNLIKQKGNIQKGGGSPIFEGLEGLGHKPIIKKVTGRGSPIAQEHVPQIRSITGKIGSSPIVEDSLKATIMNFLVSPKGIITTGVVGTGTAIGILSLDQWGLWASVDNVMQQESIQIRDAHAKWDAGAYSDAEMVAIMEESLDVVDQVDTFTEKSKSNPLVQWFTPSFLLAIETTKDTMFIKMRDVENRAGLDIDRVPTLALDPRLDPDARQETFAEKGKRERAEAGVPPQLTPEEFAQQSAAAQEKFNKPAAAGGGGTFQRNVPFPEQIRRQGTGEAFTAQESFDIEGQPKSFSQKRESPEERVRLAALDQVLQQNQEASPNELLGLQGSDAEKAVNISTPDQREKERLLLLKKLKNRRGT